MADYLSGHTVPHGRPGSEYRYDNFADRISSGQQYSGNPGSRDFSGETGSERPGASEELNGGRKKNNFNRAQMIRRVLNILIILLLGVLVLELVFHVLIAPSLELKHVQLDSDLTMTMKEVEQAGGFSTGDAFYRLSEADIQSRLQALPEVLEAEVERIFPDSLGVRIRQREEMAILMLQTERGVVPAAVDSQGVIFRSGKEIRNWELPVIHGIELEQTEPGVQLNTAQQRMLEDVHAIMNESPQVLRAFSELRMDEVYPGIYEWVLIPVHMHVKLRAAMGLDAERTLFMLKTLDMLKDRGLEGIDEIDFRTGDVIYSNERGEYGLE